MNNSAYAPAGSAVRSKSTLETLLGTPVFYWSLLGCGTLVLVTYLLVSWISSPFFAPAPTGGTPIPEAQIYLIRVVEGISAGLGVAFLLKFIFLPLVKERTIPWDGMMLIALFITWWTDPLDNYVNMSFFYNAYAVNMSSWATFIPGFGYPNAGNFPEPLLLMGGIYLWFQFGAALLGCAGLRFMKTRYPNASMVLLLVVLFLCLGAVDLLLETFFMWTSIAAYPGVIQSVSIWAGEPMQWPLYEAGLMGAVWTGYTCFRFFRDDKGLSFAERGLDKIRLKGGKRKLVSFLAIVGFLNSFFLVTYYLPYNMFAIQADTIPAYPSYLRAGLCGEGTAYACPSKQHVPIPRDGASLFIGPDDARLPVEVRLKQNGEPYGWFSGAE